MGLQDGKKFEHHAVWNKLRSVLVSFRLCSSGRLPLPLPSGGLESQGHSRYRRVAGCMILCMTVLAIMRLVDFIRNWEISMPPPDFARLHGDVKSCLTNPDHALGDGDLRVAFSLEPITVIEWKLKLMREANHSVFFADVMGGKVLDAAVDILEAKLKNIPHFQVLILHYAREDGRMRKRDHRIDELARAYQDRMHYFFISLDNFEFPSSIHCEKIHIKTVIADYGKYFTLGGSAWVDAAFEFNYESDFIFEDAAGIVGPGLWNSIVDATADFVHEFADKYRKADVDIEAQLHMRDFRTPQMCSQAGVDACGFPYRLSSSSFKRMSIPISKPELYFTGPGQPTTRNAQFHDAIVDAIEASKSRIVFEHKYFVLSERINDALIKAAIRGVRILIVTQGITDEGGLHGLAAFGISASNDVASAGILSSGKHVTVYQFIGGKNSLIKGFHKKVVIVDDVVLAGSANMGPKSMLQYIDLEMTFRLESKAFADEYDILSLKDAHEFCAGVHGVSTLSFVLAHVWHFIRGFTTFANY